MADEEIVRSYARDVLGMKDDELDEYLWLAEESMRAPMPPGWEQFEDEARGKPYYVNATTGVTQWDHPSDECYRENFARLKESAKGRPSSARKARRGGERRGPGGGGNRVTVVRGGGAGAGGRETRDDRGGDRDRDDRDRASPKRRPTATAGDGDGGGGYGDDAPRPRAAPGRARATPARAPRRGRRRRRGPRPARYGAGRDGSDDDGGRSPGRGYGARRGDDAPRPRDGAGAAGNAAPNAAPRAKGGARPSPPRRARRPSSPARGRRRRAPKAPSDADLGSPDSATSSSAFRRNRSRPGEDWGTARGSSKTPFPAAASSATRSRRRAAGEPAPRVRARVVARGSDAATSSGRASALPSPDAAAARPQRSPWAGLGDDRRFAAPRRRGAQEPGRESRRELDASAAADRETVALAQVEDLRTTLADAEALLRESRHENAALRRQADIAAPPAEQEKLAALRALDQARHDLGAAERARENAARVHEAQAQALAAETAAEMQRSLRRDAQQAEEIATLHQALADVEARAQLHVDREHAHFQDARLDADARADENGKLRAAVDELQGRLDGALRALAALEDDERRRSGARPSPVRRQPSGPFPAPLAAAPPQAQPLEPRRSVPPTITENARYSPRGDDATAAHAVSVGVAALVASDADAPRVTRSLDRLQYSLSDADDLRSVNTRISLATRTSVDSAASAQTAYTHRSLEGPGFHRGYWQRAYGGNPRELFPNAAAA
ncbi:hypothetical protein JL721_5817 [Aureococcus anophagefferens]|nr:hypothetical protein JL721_5817 [Aureococcus anophagefferens]